MAELRECWCGSTKTRVVEQGHTWNGLRRCDYRGCCLECGLTTPVFDERDQAITAWNARAYDAEMEGLRGNLEAMTDMYRAAERAVSRLGAENQMLRGMINNGLGWEDMKNDCT